MLPRHGVARALLYFPVGAYVKCKYRIKVEKFRESGKRPYLILFNHQTGYDQFFVSMAFDRPVYFVASDDIFSNGFSSALIRYLVAPIPITKQSADVGAVMTCIRVAKEGGTIAIAPEGNRTFGGSPCYINDTIVPLARKLGMPILLFRIEGGYGVHPRWSDRVRRGGMTARVSRVIEPAEYSEMTDGELLLAIKDGLHTVEGRGEKSYPDRRAAEYIERAFYTCSDCGMTELYSNGRTVTCTKCGCRVTVNDDMTLSGEGLPYKNIGEWYDWQSNYINSIDPRALGAAPLHTAACELFLVVPNRKKRCVARGTPLALYADRLEVGGIALPFCDTSVITVLGKNKLNIYHGDRVYQIKGGRRFCALRYMNIFYRVKNLEGKRKNDGFLGL
ncbi:MAG: 1-acyl-sn-glycerol-3-phosphate acyltransferase, partial [Clostridia bacterium]|nr:1-acyl-sn-glycerol-3-phosphate acyltransferase [Clostridia bacterium]